MYERIWSICTYCNCLLPVESSVEGFQQLSYQLQLRFIYAWGSPLWCHICLPEGLVRLFARDGLFLGVGEMLDDGRVAPRRLVSTPRKMAMVMVRLALFFNQ